MSPTPSPKLFDVAAAYNLLAGLPLLIAGPAVGRLLGMQPLPDRSVFEQISIGAVLLFGWAYWQVARDPLRFRPYITLGIVGKLVFVAVIYAHWALGNVNAVLPVLVAGDLVFAALFWRYLKLTPQNP